MPATYIALGSNLPSAAGTPADTLSAAVARLGSFGHVAARSALYSTTPVGFSDQPRFLNAVVAFHTARAPHALLTILLNIEQQFGRNRVAAVPNGPRTLDLDLLFYGDLVVSETGLEIPHPRLAERAFVLVPLNEIAPQLRHPCSGRTVNAMLQELAQRSGPLSLFATSAVNEQWTDKMSE